MVPWNKCISFTFNSTSWNYIVPGNFYCNVIKESSQNARLQWKHFWKYYTRFLKACEIFEHFVFELPQIQEGCFQYRYMASTMLPYSSYVHSKYVPHMQRLWCRMKISYYLLVWIMILCGASKICDLPEFGCAHATWRLLDIVCTVLKPDLGSSVGFFIYEYKGQNVNVYMMLMHRTSY